MKSLTRRRFLTISAAAALMPGATGADVPITRWRGHVLGAHASMTLAGVDGDRAAEPIDRAVAEIERLEKIFSLYRRGSAILRFNETGQLADPPPEMLELLALCSVVHRETGGAFDPTVQPLWQLHAKCGVEGRQATEAEIAEARSRTGWQKLRLDTAAVRAGRPGMALTLNGIAQGYVADRIAALLRDAGLTGVLVDMGEIRAHGRQADGRPWRVGIVGPEDAGIAKKLPLVDRALATSAMLGTVLDRAGQVGHIIDPRTGRAGGRWRLASVSAPTAVLADGLSTAIPLMRKPDIDHALAAIPNAKLELLV